MLTPLTFTSSITVDLVLINLIRESPIVEYLRVNPLTTRLATDDAVNREAYMLDPSIDRFAIVTNLQELASRTTVVLEKPVKVLFSKSTSRLFPLNYKSTFSEYPFIRLPLIDIYLCEGY